jgi:hypothetical protein
MSYKTNDLYDGLTISFRPRKSVLILYTLLYDTLAHPEAQSSAHSDAGPVADIVASVRDSTGARVL